MVIVKIVGGLGNQLFQYAFGRAIEKKYDYVVKYDFSYYDNISKEDTFCNVFVSRYIPSHKIATDAEIKEVVKNDTCFLKKILKRLGLAEYHTKYERLDDGITDICQVKDNTLLIGYWQAEKYFLNVSDEIRKTVTFKEHMFPQNMVKIMECIRSSHSVSIHVRGGDYLLQENQSIFGGICTSEYYEKAYAYMQNKTPDCKFFLFTNDIAWAKKHIHLPYDDITIVCNEFEATEDWMDLYLMSLCNDNILANSSYSWWAAWLNVHEDKNVICPDRWTNDNQHSDIFCKSWIKMGEKDKS